MKKNWEGSGISLDCISDGVSFRPGKSSRIFCCRSNSWKWSNLCSPSWWLLAGGLFGIYVILIAVKIHYERKKMKLLQDIRNDVDKLTIHFGIKHAHPAKNIFKRILHFFVPEENGHDKKIIKNEDYC